MHFEYKDMVVSTVPIIRMESRTEQGTEKTEETTQTTEETTENKEDEELIKEYKTYMKSVQSGIGDSVMVTMFCGVGIYLLVGLILALILSKYFKLR